MTRTAVLLLAVTLSGAPVGSLLCEVTCETEAAATTSTPCHDQGSTGAYVSRSPHDCDHPASAEAVPEMARDTRAPMAIPASNADIDDLPPTLGRASTRGLTPPARLRSSSTTLQLRI